MAFSLLPALRPRDWHSTICVRVCRKWEYRGGTDDGPIQHVDLVLVDEQGNSMYGEIPAQEVQAKSPLIEENGIYVISRFRVSNAKSGYRPVDARYMVEFTLHTTVSAARTDMPDFPKHAYKIVPIDALPAHAGDTKNFLDTIGTLVGVSDVHTVHLPNKPVPTLSRHIILRDLSYSEIKITLWGQRATAFTTAGVYNASDAKPIVVLFVGGLMKSFQGNYYLSANAASRWYFNPSIPEARQFYASLHNQRLEIRSVPVPVEQEGHGQLPAQLEEKTLRELNDMGPYEFAENGYRCTVTIGRLVPNASWWFPSCTKCSKSCVPDGAGYRCNPCSNTSFKFKYKLCFMALDGTDEGEMICFGDVARRIVGKPVQQVLRTSTSSNAYPPDIARLASLRFTFVVTMTQQSYYKAQKTYNVTSVVTSYGQQVAAPPAPEDGNNGQPGAADADVAIAATPVTEDGLSLQMLENTPPPKVHEDTPPVEKYKCDGSEKIKHSSARKRLILDSDDDEQPSLEEDEAHGSVGGTSPSTTHKSIVPAGTPAAKEKRPRRASSVSQESG